jgi:hypothetical protein
MKEFPQAKDGPFSCSESFVDTVVLILQAVLQTNENNGQLICDCYDLLLEAGLHCDKAWKTFTEHNDLDTLHHSVLLAHPMTSVRSTIWQLIKIKLERFTP